MERLPRNGGFLREDLVDFIGFNQLKDVLEGLNWPVEKRRHYTAREVWTLLAYHHFLRGRTKVPIKKMPPGLWMPGQREEKRPPPPPPPPKPHDESPALEELSLHLKRKLKTASKEPQVVRTGRVVPTKRETENFPTIYVRGRLLRRR